MDKDNLHDKLRERFAKLHRPFVVTPAPKSKPSGLYQHFETEEARQKYLAEVAKNEGAF